MSSFGQGSMGNIGFPDLSKRFGQPGQLGTFQPGALNMLMNLYGGGQPPFQHPFNPNAGLPESPVPFPPHPISPPGSPAPITGVPTTGAPLQPIHGLPIGQAPVTMNARQRRLHKRRKHKYRGEGPFMPEHPEPGMDYTAEED